MNDANQPNDYLHDQGLSSLYQQSKHDEPSMALDSAILQQAGKAVAKKSRWSSLFNFNWLIPAASTAMILLAVTITYQNRDSALVQEKPMTAMSDSALLQKRSIAKNEVPSPEPMQSFAGNVSIADVQPEPQQESLSEAKVASAPREMKKSKRMADPAVTQMDEVIVSEAELGMAAHADREIPTDVAEPVLQAAPQAVSRSKEQAGTDRFAAKAVAKRQALSMPEKTVANEVRQELRDPKAWLKEIEELLNQGKEDEAREEFKAFRKQFPNYDVEEEFLKKLSIAQ